MLLLEVQPIFSSFFGRILPHFVGAYYTSSKTIESKYILGVVLETMKIFHLYGFNTCVLVCDGASSNLTTIKTTMGESGVFESTATMAPSFSNPFNPSRKHWVICPSHQVCVYVHISCVHVYICVCVCCVCVRACVCAFSLAVL